MFPEAEVAHRCWRKRVLHEAGGEDRVRGEEILLEPF